MYGGHITDDWDRLLCSTYLKFYLKEELLDEMELFPFNESYQDERFRSPPVMPYDEYSQYIDQELSFDSPVAFGLHPNTEIGVKTTQAEELFCSIMELQPRTAAAGGAEGVTPQERVETVCTLIEEKVKSINYNLTDIASQIVDERGPFQNVFMQECERMNILVGEMLRSLHELQLGLRYRAVPAARMLTRHSGELQMSERMEQLFQSLYMGRVPGNWEILAYDSLRSLAAWVDNLVQRSQQLQSWVDDPTSVPTVVEISYLFNPQSFLTAIMQTTAQTQKLELDKLVIQTDVTRKTVQEIDAPARTGAFVAGLYMEGKSQRAL